MIERDMFRHKKYYYITPVLAQVLFLSIAGLCLFFGYQFYALLAFIAIGLNLWAIKFLEKQPAVYSIFIAAGNAFFSILVVYLGYDITPPTFTAIWVLLATLFLLSAFRFLTIAQKKYL